MQALRELHALGVRTVLLSGDNQVTAEAIARAVGIDDAHGDLLPEEKRAAIEALRAGHGSVGMVGDGVNDAPALAAATVSFAMGAAGTDAAIETADVALMRDDLHAPPEFIRLSRRTAAILKRQNLALAIGSKAVFFVLALAGVATMWMAVLADMGATLLVVANGLRLRTATAPARSRGPVDDDGRPSPPCRAGPAPPQPMPTCPLHARPTDAIGAQRFGPWRRKSSSRVCLDHQRRVPPMIPT